MELKIDSIALEDSAFEKINRLVELRTDKQIEFRLSQIEKRYSFPRFMNKQQAAKYMNISYNTLMQKYVPAGLKLSIIDGVVRISQEECDRFIKENQK